METENPLWRPLTGAATMSVLRFYSPSYMHTASFNPNHPKSLSIIAVVDYFATNISLN